MECKESRELVLTDYLDGEMDERKKVSLEEHLSRCVECKEFAMEAKRIGKELFSGAAKAEPPEYLWGRIKSLVLAEAGEKKSAAVDIIGRLKGIFSIPKPVFAAAVIIILIFAVGTAIRVGINSQKALELRIQDQIGYFDYLPGASTDPAADENGSFGTQVEQYFL
ncbi:MAG: anti-sigma factor [Candidatus Omnitrophica bacterium]|nr:anti-sigma factor [Candidatus Omnitrophota bacterium]MDD5436664.1 anti-sigma factor [Candidatus Omnitrophota bacterium]